MFVKLKLFQVEELSGSCVNCFSPKNHQLCGSKIAPKLSASPKKTLKKEHLFGFLAPHIFVILVNVATNIDFPSSTHIDSMASGALRGPVACRAKSCKANALENLGNFP